MSPLRKLGKVRLSTIILAMVFVVAFVSYLFVRPEPETTGGQPAGPAVEQREESPRPRPTSTHPTRRESSTPATPRPTTSTPRPSSPTPRPSTEPTRPSESPTPPSTPPSPSRQAPDDGSAVPSD